MIDNPQERKMHMQSQLFSGLVLAGILTAPIAAQMQEGYLDVQIAKVKMGKRSEFDAVNKRLAEINRKNKGDQWLAYETIYGPGNTVFFVSTRTGYGAAGEALAAFEGSITRALGQVGMRKLLNDWDATVEAERMEFRRRRWDLSASVPSDSAAYNRLVGQSRFLRTAVVRVRPGRIPDYETQLKAVKEAQERVNEGVPTFVSQAVAGQETGVFYITTLLKSLPDLDRIKPLQEVLGSAYGSYQRTLAENVLGTEILIGRFLPELSNPPEEIAAIDAKFWQPAPPPAAAPKKTEKK